MYQIKGEISMKTKKNKTVSLNSSLKFVLFMIIVELSFRIYQWADAAIHMKDSIYMRIGLYITLSVRGDIFCLAIILAWMVFRFFYFPVYKTTYKVMNVIPLEIGKKNSKFSVTDIKCFSDIAGNVTIRVPSKKIKNEILKGDEIAGTYNTEKNIAMINTKASSIFPTIACSLFILILICDFLLYGVLIL